MVATSSVMAPSSQRIRMLIVEDEGLFRDLLCRSLSTDRMEVLEGVTDGETAIRLARELMPDVVLLDIHLAGEIDGIAAGLRIKEERPETGIVILSAHNDRRYLSGIPPEQASGWSYVLKQSVRDLSTLTRAIEGSACGLMTVDPAVISDLKPREGTLLAGLTQRQLEVLELMAEGYNNASLAKALHVGEKTVENYINAIYQQLQVSADKSLHPRVRATLLYLQETRKNTVRAGSASTRLSFAAALALPL